MSQISDDECVSNLAVADIRTVSGECQQDIAETDDTI